MVSPAPDVAAGGDGVRVTLAELIGLRVEASRLRIARRGRILATRHGGHLSRFRGRGMEFDEARLYQPGDDPRNMDWRVTARAGQPHVKCFREERERPVWLLVDQGPTMRFASRVAFKSVVAARAAALLGWSVTEGGDRLGGLVFDEAHHLEQRPVARTRGLLPVLKGLATLPERGGCGGFTGLSAAAEHLTHRVRPGSLVFLLSDFADLAAEDAWVGQLAAASELVLIQVVDPLERQAPPPGRYPVSDGRRVGWLDTRSGASRRVYAERFAAREARLVELTRRWPAHLVRLSTAEPVGPALARGLAAGRAR
ncbi:DUF58 domain-containing protein [Thioflavicoccus mobilis]|nr:DUF58 domain-containing protein [Thioflavicoccus mobilis]